MTPYIGDPPTLRFVIRPVMRVDPWDGPYQTGESRVLQYGLRPVSGGPVEWFDVPVIESEVPATTKKRKPK